MTKKATIAELQERLDDLRTNEALAYEGNQDAQYDKIGKLITKTTNELGALTT